MTNNPRSFKKNLLFTLVMKFDFFKSLILIFLFALIKFRLTDQHLRRIVPSKSKSFALFSSLSMSEDDFEEEKARNDLLKKGLRLWNDFFVANEAWNSLKSKYFKLNVNIFNFCICASLNSKRNLIDMSITNALFKKYPMIWDVIAISVKETPMERDEIEDVVNFFLDNKKLRQLAAMISLQDPPITFDHFKYTPIESRPFKTRTLALASLFEHLFMMNPQKLNQLFQHLGEDKLFMVTSLIVCKNQLPSKVRQIISNLINSEKIDNNLLIYHICLGLMFCDCCSDEEAEAVFYRNEKLVDYLYTILKPFENNDIHTLIALKACRIVNLVNIYPDNEQKILSLIHMDEPVDIKEQMFTMFSNIIPQKHKKEFAKYIDSFRNI